MKVNSGYWKKAKFIYRFGKATEFFIFFRHALKQYILVKIKVEINKTEKIHEKKMTPAFFLDFTRQFLLLWMVTTGKDLCLLVCKLQLSIRDYTQSVL